MKKKPLKVDHRIRVILSDEVDEFLSTLPLEAKKKIIFNVDKVAANEKDSEIFSKLGGTDDIWEFRTLYNRIKYRLLAFWDTEEETLIITTHGFIKKTQKTPLKEINHAESVKKQYFETKQKNQKK
ncbi:MAG: type II toxin-antitoxin system RelE/ParE family toxin [Bacteroidales bacterium]|nr:type II toxin-antitoxin system RelE/ParE family toxin [Bacteroidales bacterium]